MFHAVATLAKHIPYPSVSSSGNPNTAASASVANRQERSAAPLPPGADSKRFHATFASKVQREKRAAEKTCNEYKNVVGQLIDLLPFPEAEKGNLREELQYVKPCKFMPTKAEGAMHLGVMQGRLGALKAGNVDILERPGLARNVKSSIDICREFSQEQVIARLDRTIQEVAAPFRNHELKDLLPELNSHLDFLNRQPCSQDALDDILLSIRVVESRIR